MKTKVLLFFLMLVTSLSAAQEVQSPSYNRDIGFNTSFIFSGIFESSATPFSFMYKRYKTKDRATRIGADLSFNLTDTDIDTVRDQYTDDKSLAISISLGKEFQKHLSAKWVWYYGFDVVPGVSLTKYENHYHNYVLPESFRSYSSTSYSLSVRPFLGIRFNVMPRVYVAAEANASIAFRFSETLEKQHNPDEVLKDFQNTSVNFGMNPASGIFVYYRF